MKSDMTNFWTYVGQGLAILLICVGMGTCAALSSGYIRIGQQPEKVENDQIN